MATADELLQEAIGWVFAAEHDFPRTKTTFPYVVLTTPRTGSTMLCSSLAATRLAGVPFEYLNDWCCKAYARRTGVWDFQTYLNDLRARRTSPNGYWGLKLHSHQHEKRFGGPGSQAGANFLKLFRRVIRTYRRDKVDQAISQMLARERRVWNTTNPGARPVERGFQPDDIDRISVRLQDILAMERYWDDLLPTLDLQRIAMVAYEDLVADVAGETSRLLAHLGINVPPAKVPLPTTVKLAGSGSREIKQEYLRATKSSAAA